MDRRLGYYTCNGKEFESKIQALMYATIVNQEPRWYFNNEVFDNYNWAQEPELDLDQYYDRRAREIREQYDYVILSYSGGSDSNNVLESFLRQGLLIDEVVTHWSLDASKRFLVHDVNERSSWNLNAEFQLNTANRLNYIRNASPRTKITVNDTSQALVDSFLKAGDASWVQDKREVLNANGTNNYNYTYFKDIRETFDRGKRIALVLGIEKPKVRIIDNKLYLFFIDKLANIISVQDHIQEYPNARTEYFYWSPDCTDLLAKQSHVMLKFINANPQYKSAFESRDHKIIRTVQEDLYKKCLYTTWNPTWFQVKKPFEDWDCEFDYWFSRGWAGTREHAIWHAGLDHVAKRINKFLIRNEDGTVQGRTVPFFSPFYYIGPVTV